jgi:gas vesicle protein GvpL/GvpF
MSWSGWCRWLRSQIADRGSQALPPHVSERAVLPRSAIRDLVLPTRYYSRVLYVYVVTRVGAMPRVDGIDGTRRFGVAVVGDVAAIFTAVNPGEFSQEAIDRRAGDLEWLGAVGYRHQAVVADVMKAAAIVPLRAFTLFSSEEALRAYLDEHREMLSAALDRLDGKQEWTMRIELEPARWSEALSTRVESLRALQRDIESAAPGKAFLLRKKLDDERKRASRAAEEELLVEIEREVIDRLHCETVAESRERRDGAFPEINVLINRDEEAVLEELHVRLAEHYAREGVTLALSGPWPPYTFAHV